MESFLKEETEKRIKLEFIDKKLKLINNDTIYQLIRDIKDPEYPYTLERLGVVNKEDIKIGEISKSDAISKLINPIKYITIIFTPTVPHCHLAGIIGLSLMYQLEKYTKNYWIRIEVKEETHNTYQALNKQLSDKDRVMAAFENENLIEIIDECCTIIN